MELYILKSGVCLAIFYGFYMLVLEKVSFHIFKRFYLLASLLLAFGIPFITYTEYIEVTHQITNSALFLQSNDLNTTITTQQTNYIPLILWSIYSLGVFLFSIKFIKNLFKITNTVKHNPKLKNKRFTNVLLQESIIPHTFFSYIFLNKKKFETNQIPEEVLLHEETHALQKHSLDVLFVEVLQIIFWFNPLIYYIKHSIKLNHEFLADQSVINNGITPSTYQQILLAFSSNASEPQLANAINYSSIKKRFTVMKTQTSKQAFWFRSLILLPIVGILIYSFSDREIIEREASEPYVITQNIKLKNGATEAMMTEYKDFIKSTESSNMIYNPKYQRAIAIYDLMSEAQRATVKKYPENIAHSLSNVKPKTPTLSQLDSWKDSNKYAIWIDGKHIKNTELNNYHTSDFKYFTSSFVHNNARSDKFPQAYQNHLYTQKVYEENYLKANLNSFNKLKNKYLKAINDNTLNSDELRILNSQLDRAYEKLSVTEKENVDYRKFNGRFNKGNTTKVLGNQQQKATPKQVAEYNKLAKQYNAQPEASRVIKLNELKRLEYIYNKMTKEQKASAEPFPNCPPPPPPTKSPQYQNGKKLTLNEIIKKTPKDVESGYKVLDNGETHYFTIYKGRKTYYNKDGYITDDKGTVLPPPPPAPAPKVKRGEVSDIPPPPPPAPKSPLDHVIDMSKKGATFNFEGKPISSDEAIDLLKKNNKLNISTISKNGKSIVTIQSKPIIH